MDIETRKDIEKFIILFYDKVKRDDVIGYIFNDIAKMNWEEHVPVIVDFWETILLDNPIYKRNAMEVHYALDHKEHLQPAHFERWLKLFTETIDENFEGTIATLAKTRTKGIAAVMQVKMQQAREKRSIL